MNDLSNDAPRSFEELIRETYDLGSNITGIPNQKTLETSIREGSYFSFVPKHISDLTLENAKIDWIWEGFLAKGHLTLLSALWKSGKSTLVSQLLKAVQGGSQFAGQVTNASKILILSEESEAMWARRREELNLEIDCWITSRPIKKRLNYDEWINLLKKSADFCKENDIDLLVVDTLSGFWNVTDENNAAFVNSALLPINELLGKNIAVLLIHHFRKSGGSEGVATRGSGALGSYADILIEFSRLDGQNPNDKQRQLRNFSRFEETPTEVVIEMVDGEYVTRGTRAEVSKEARAKKVLLILTKDKSGGLTVSEISDEWDTEELGNKPTKRTIRNYIESLLTDGRVNQTGTKLVGKTQAPIYSVINDGNGNSHNVGKSSMVDTPFEANNERKETPLSNTHTDIVEQAREIFGEEEIK